MESLCLNFKDRLERTVLERRIESRLKGDKQLSDTYYIYDDLGKLCAVLLLHCPIS